MRKYILNLSISCLIYLAVNCSASGSRQQDATPFQLELPPVATHVVPGGRPYYWLHHFNHVLFLLTGVYPDFTPGQRADIICALATRVSQSDFAIVNLHPRRSGPFRFGFRFTHDAGKFKLLTLHSTFNIRHRRPMAAGDPKDEEFMTAFLVEDDILLPIGRSYDEKKVDELRSRTDMLDLADFLLLDNRKENDAEAVSIMAGLEKNDAVPFEVRFRAFLSLGQFDLIQDNLTTALARLPEAESRLSRQRGEPSVSDSSSLLVLYKEELSMFPQIRACILNDGK